MKALLRLQDNTFPIFRSFCPEPLFYLYRKWFPLSSCLVWRDEGDRGRVSGWRVGGRLGEWGSVEWESRIGNLVKRAIEYYHTAQQTTCSNKWSTSPAVLFCWPTLLNVYCSIIVKLINSLLLYIALFFLAHIVFNLII